MRKKKRVKKPTEAKGYRRLIYSPDPSVWVEFEQAIGGASVSARLVKYMRGVIKREAAKS